MPNPWQFLAQKKAHACRNFLTQENQILLTADSVVLIDNEVLNKPADYTEAFAMIRRLAGSMHTVVTGVCLLDATKEIVFKDETKVWLDDLTDAEIDYYITNFKPFDSPTPFSPGHNAPSSAQPAEVSRNLITLQAIDTTASPSTGSA